MKDEKGQNGVVISVYFGDDSHELTLSGEEWSKIVDGEGYETIGESYEYEGEEFDTTWVFDGGLDGGLSVWYGDDGGTGFEGTLSDAEITYL